MNALPNATANALPHGGARGYSEESVAGTVHAKTREGKTREGKGRHHTSPHRKFLGVETSIPIVQLGDGSARAPFGIASKP